VQIIFESEYPSHNRIVVKSDWTFAKKILEMVWNDMTIQALGNEFKVDMAPPTERPEKRRRWYVAKDDEVIEWDPENGSPSWLKKYMGKDGYDILLGYWLEKIDNGDGG